MATSDRRRPNIPARRWALRQLVLLAAAPWAAIRPASAHPAAGVLAASWQEEGRHFAGLLSTAPGNAMRLVHREAVPARAHAVIAEPRTILVASRRPGDWLLRFDPRRRAPTVWCWNEGEHFFNGHVVASGDGRRLYSTETSLETGAGSIGVRAAGSFELLARWPTAGIDPHEIVRDSDGGLWVANGGIETHPETGRAKHHLDRMDSSLVRLDAASGRLTGQWRLADRRLGLRHLALAADGTLGVALQAEHDDPEARSAAPVLAVWNRRRGLHSVALPAGITLAGYGGSVARQGDGLAVSCPRANRVARWTLHSGEAHWQAPLELPEACPLAQGWCGGVGAVVYAGTTTRGPVERWTLPAAIRLDNHWVLTPFA